MTRPELKAYSNKKVFVTGHTGFKGSWFVEYLNLLGAKVKGYSLEPNTERSHYEILNSNCESIIGDIRDLEKLKKEMKNFNPDIVFHMAAQPLVRESYLNPVENYSTNIMGTVNLFEAIRENESVSAVVNITTDKCYENKEWIWGYRENEAMGGYDPYSASKGCSELITSSYRNSFFNLEKYGKDHNCLVASARAGNVIGGGDWSKDRIIPDIIRSITNKSTLEVRSPKATRPWQHVLEPLTGYLFLGANLLDGKKEFSEGWNFGPSYSEVRTVEDLVKMAKSEWGDFEYSIFNSDTFHEANLLKLDSTKAKEKLNWSGLWSAENTIETTIRWYKQFYKEDKVSTQEQLRDYLDLLHQI